MRSPPHIITTFVLGLGLAAIPSTASAASLVWHQPAGLQAACSEVPEVCGDDPEAQPDPSSGQVVGWDDRAGVGHSQVTAAGDADGFAAVMRRARLDASESNGLVVAIDDVGRVRMRIEPGSIAEAAYPEMEAALADDSSTLSATLSDAVAVRELDEIEVAPPPSAATEAGTTPGRGVVKAQCDCQTLQDGVSAAITALTSAQKAEERALIQLTEAQMSARLACMWLTRIGCRIAGRHLMQALRDLLASKNLVATAKDILASAEALLHRCMDRVRDDPDCKVDDVSGDQRLGARVWAEPRRAFGMALA